LRIKEQETHLTLQEHDDDDELYFIYIYIYIHSKHLTPRGLSYSIRSSQLKPIQTQNRRHSVLVSCTRLPIERKGCYPSPVSCIMFGIERACTEIQHNVWCRVLNVVTPRYSLNPEVEYLPITIYTANLKISCFMVIDNHSAIYTEWAKSRYTVYS